MFFKVAVDNQKDLKDLNQSCCFFFYHADIPGVDDVDVSHQVLPGQKAL